MDVDPWEMSKGVSKRISRQSALQQTKGLSPLRAEIKKGSQVDKYLDGEQGYGSILPNSFDSCVRRLRGSSVVREGIWAGQNHEKGKIELCGLKILRKESIIKGKETKLPVINK